MIQLSTKEVFEKINETVSLKHWKLSDIACYSLEENDISTLIPVRDRFANKNNFGHALLIAGSRGKMGAAVLSAKACLRSGAGLLTVRTPACGEAIMQIACPEAMVDADTENHCISGIFDLTKYNAIGVGPGIGTDSKTAKALFNLFNLLRDTGKTLIIDADALNLMSSNRDLFEAFPPGSILTPHIGEFDRLTGISATACFRLQKAVLLAEKLQSYIILKGAHTVICTPERQCYFNSTGNPGMATAGSGDVLTGILLGLVAQSYTAFHAAITGVFLHGLSGDIAASVNSEESMIAGDIIANLGATFKKITYFCAQSDKQ